MKDHRDFIFTVLAVSAAFAAGCPETQHLDPCSVFVCGDNGACWTNRCVEGYACYEETGTCVPPLETLCGEEFPELPLEEIVAGELDGLSSLTAGTCGGDGPEDVYRLTIPAGVTDVTITTDLPGTGGTDTVLYVRELCEAATDAEVECNDDDGSLHSTVGFSVAEGEDYYVFVDTFRAGGRYEILATALP